MSTPVQIYDTTLRDGTQGEGVSFSVTDKLLITARLDEFGIDIIEGGFPGSNPRDIAYFEEVKKLKLRHSKLAAFGSTCRVGGKAEDDAQLKTLLSSCATILTLVGKTSLFHVAEILKTTPEENLRLVSDSIKFLTSEGRNVIFDAEHFFDGYKINPEYSLTVLSTALKAGAMNVTLCDTNGGTLPSEFSKILAHVVQEFGGERVGIHTHNDGGMAVALTLAGVEAGASLIQGTINGYGERTGNANLTTLMPALALKMKRDFAAAKNLPKLRELSLTLDELANLRHDTKAPYVGASAFAHKGGLHANAALKVKSSYEHIDPALVGNTTRVLVSDLAGRGSIEAKAREFGFDFSQKPEALKELLEELKLLEHQGYEFEAADASLILRMLKKLRLAKDFFTTQSYRVAIERRGEELAAEATIKLSALNQTCHTVAEGNGPVAALDKALRAALEPLYPELKTITLSDYKVRILDGKSSTGSRTRVLIESTDGHKLWGTVGVSDNIIDASYQALADAYLYKLSGHSTQKQILAYQTQAPFSTKTKEE